MILLQYWVWELMNYNLFKKDNFLYFVVNFKKYLYVLLYLPFFLPYFDNQKRILKYKGFSMSILPLWRCLVYI